MRVLALAFIAAAACSSASTTTPPSAAPRPPADVPMSDPDEYRIDHVSRDAGRAIFTRTGLGDPYKVGIPYPIFLALEAAYPARFGADHQALAARFGFVARAPDPDSDDRDLREGLPVGLHLTDDPITGVPFVVHNCTLCHAERVRWPGGEALITGLGNKRVRIHAYDRAFVTTARDPGFDLATIAPLAERAAAEHGVAWPYDWRVPLVDATVRALHDRAAARHDYLDRLREDPPGRVATIEAFAEAMSTALGVAIDTGPDIGWAKIPDVVGFGSRTTLSFDGVGEGPMDVLVVEADFAAGVRPAWFWAHPLQGASLSAYLRQPEPGPAFPGPIDRTLAARGKELFDFHCGPCHGSYADDGRVVRYDETVVDLDDIGTDPARSHAVTDGFLAAANDRRLTGGVTSAHRTGGYVPPVLTRVWARAPYGHAGQWPSLAFLALAPERRPTTYILRLDALYDLDAVGVPYRTDGAAATAGEDLHDGRRPGRSVLGHPFLSDVGPEARAVIEYLKTL